MGRPRGGTNRSHSKEEKLALVKRNLAGKTASALEKESGIYHTQIHKWTKQYAESGEEALVNKRKPGNRLAKYARRKELTPTEQLEYKVALLEREEANYIFSNKSISYRLLERIGKTNRE